MLVTLITLAIKCVCYFLLCMLTAYIILYGKRGSGIKLDYSFCAVALIITLVVL